MPAVELAKAPTAGEATEVGCSKSAKGQTRTSADVCDTTASPPEADMPDSPRDVAEGPRGDIGLSAVLQTASHREATFASTPQFLAECKWLGDIARTFNK